jgi:large subunit ribosomal protein L2
MPIKTFRPITPTLRFQTKLVNDDITTNEPHKPLLTVKPRTGGRNNMGKLSIRHQGGGHKQKLRLIDFKRDKYGIPTAARASRSSITPTARSATSFSRSG